MPVAEQLLYDRMFDLAERIRYTPSEELILTAQDRAIMNKGLELVGFRITDVLLRYLGAIFCKGDKLARAMLHI